MIGIGAKITPAREFTPEQRLFLSLEREKGTKYSELCKLFKTKWSNKQPPSRNGLWNIINKLKTFHTLQNRRPNVSGRPRTARNDENIDAVRELKVVAEEGGAFEGENIRI